MLGRRRLMVGCILVLVALGRPRSATADVAVLANRSAQPVRYRTSLSEASPASPTSGWATIETGDVAPVLIVGDGLLEFSAGDAIRSYKLAANRCYFFYETDGGLELEAIGLVGGQGLGGGEHLRDRDAARGTRPGAGPAESTPAKLPSIRVKLLVDDDERAAPARWEARLRARLAAASEVFERCCGVKFETVAVGTWRSDGLIADFERSLEEFERAVPPRPADLAIGFTSQYRAPAGRTHLGGIRGPLRPQILIREWSQHFSESERLELLIHELGHFLGAAHSPEAGSVMRPVLGDRQARVRSFRITFDPLNALAICLVGKELQSRPASSLSALGATTRRRLGEIYSTLGRVMPDDPAAPQYLSLLDARPGRNERPLQESAPPANRPADGLVPPVEPASSALEAIPRLAANPPVPESLPPSDAASQPLREATRTVLLAVVAAARDNRALPLGRQAAREDLFRRSDDELTECCVRKAAEAAENVPQAHRRQAFCLALAIGLDASDELRALPALGDYIRSIESEQERAARREVLGVPTMRGRRDLILHFWVSAAIAAIASPSASEAAGVAKEWRDADGGSGFSFCDLCADLSGIAFAERLKTGQSSLGQVRRRFRVDAWLPPLDGLEEGLSREEFSRRFGSIGDARFQDAKQRLRARIEALYASDAAQ